MARKPKAIQPNLYAKFFSSMRDKNCQLLKHDIKFICNRLEQIPLKLHRDALRGYYSEWNIGAGKSETSTQMQNMGRRRANLWLLDFGLAQNKKSSLP